MMIDAGDDVQRVEPGGRVVERPEGVRGDRVAVPDLGRPLERLDHDEGRAARAIVRPGASRPSAVAPLGGLVGQHREQARRQQHEGVEGADPGVGVRRLWPTRRRAPGGA